MFPRAEQAFVILSFVYFTNPFVNLLYTNDSTPTSDAVPMVVQAILYTIMLLCCVGRTRELLSAAWAARWAVLLTGLTILSAAWSDVPDTTLRRAFMVTATTIFGLYLTASYSARDQLRLLAYAVSVIVVLSVGCVLLVPDYGISQHPDNFGSWQGIYHQKNALGRMGVLGVLVFACRQRPDQTATVRALGMGSCIALVLLSQSATAMIVLLILAVTLIGTRMIGPPRKAALVVLGVTVVLIGFVLTQRFWDGGAFVEMFGRDATLTGRTGIWDAVMPAIRARPWLGYGFAGFWRGMNGESASVFLTLNWMPLFAHNGFLDVALELGLVGVAGLTVAICSCASRGIRLANVGSGTDRYWTLLLVTFVVAYNFTESTTIGVNSLFWVLFVSASARTEGLRDSSSHVGRSMADASRWRLHGTQGIVGISGTATSRI
jgi:exopolysaccharide production protein ExoQ